MSNGLETQREAGVMELASGIITDAHGSDQEVARVTEILETTASTHVGHYSATESQKAEVSGVS